MNTAYNSWLRAALLMTLLAAGSASALTLGEGLNTLNGDTASKRVRIADPGPINFTCDSSTHSCECALGADCFKLGEAGVCKPGTLKEVSSKVDTYTCETKF